MFLFLLLALLSVHPSDAVLGSRIKVINNTPNLLRVMSSTTYQDFGDIHFLPSNKTVILQGYAGGKIDPDDQSTNNPYDVTFTLQRICPGKVDDGQRSLKDSFRDVLYVIANNHWYVRCARHIFVATSTRTT